MYALQPLRVQKPGRVSDNHPAIARKRRNRPPAAIRQRFRAIADHLAAFEQLRDEWMSLEFLQHVLGIGARIGIVESDYETQRNDVVFATINPRAAILARRQRPTHGVEDFTWCDAARRNFPKLFDALAVCLWIAILREIEFFYELLRQRAARAFSQNDNFCLQLISRLKIRFRLILLAQALVVGADASDAVAVGYQFRSGEPSEDGDPSFFHLAAQPLHEPVQRNHVVAMIPQRWRG